MTKTEAKKRVCKHVADLVHGQLGCGWPFEFYYPDISDEDYERMRTAFNDLLAELDRRGAK